MGDALLERQRTGGASPAQFAQTRSWWVRGGGVWVLGNLQRRSRHPSLPCCKQGGWRGGSHNTATLVTVWGKIGCWWVFWLKVTADPYLGCVGGGLLGFFFFFCIINLCSGGYHGSVLKCCCLRRCGERQCRQNVILREVAAAFLMVYFFFFFFFNPTLL